MIKMWKTVPPFMQSTVRQRFSEDEIRAAVSAMTEDGLKLAACGFFAAMAGLDFCPKDIVDFIDGKDITGERLTCFEKEECLGKQQKHSA